MVRCLSLASWLILLTALAACQGTALPALDAMAPADLARGADAALPADAAVTTGDGAAGTDGADGGPRCNGMTCAPDREFCYRVEAGLRAWRFGDSPDGGGGIMPGCNPLPAECRAAPGCDCLKQHVRVCGFGGWLSCQEDHDGFTLICALP